MKKMIIALMCTAMTIAASAQPKNDNKPCPQAGEQGDKPCCMMQQPQHHHPMRPTRQTFGPQRGSNDPIIDMQVIKKLNLDSTTVNAVRELKKQKMQEMHALMADMRPDNMPRPEMKKDAPANNDKKAKNDKKNDKKKGKKNKDIKEEKPTEGQCCNGNAQGDNKEKREAFIAKMKENREKMQALRTSCRAELHKTLGDEKYIEYLEKEMEFFNRIPRGNRR